MRQHAAPVRLAALAAALLLLPTLPATAQNKEDKPRRDVGTMSVEDMAKEIQKFQSEPFEQRTRETDMRELIKRGTVESLQVVLPLLDDKFVHMHDEVVLALDDLKEEKSWTWLGTGPLRTAKSENIRAGLAEALGRTHQKEMIPHLLEATKDGKPSVRARACEALGILGHQDATPGLVEKLADPAPEVKAAAADAIGALRDAAAMEGLLAKIGDSNALARASIVGAVARCDLEKGWEPVVKALADKAPEVRIAAIDGLALAGLKEFALGDGQAAKPAAVTLVAGRLKDEQWPVRAAAVQGLIELWDKACIDPLIDRLGEEKGRLRLDISMALKALTGKDCGIDARAWRGWWDSNKGSFEMPDKPKKWRGAVAEEQGSHAAFCKIPFLTDRALFILDLSGSMKNPAEEDAEDWGKGRDNKGGKKGGAKGGEPADNDGKADKGDKDSADKGKPKIQIAREEVEATLKAIPATVRFNIVIYRYWSSFPPKIEPQKPFPQLTPASPPAKSKGIQFVNQAEPKGWGAFYDAIVEAYRDTDVDTIYLLSDGVPSRGTHVREERIIEGVKKLNRFRRIVIHTVLTGKKGTDVEFMQALANATGGLSVKR